MHTIIIFCFLGSGLPIIKHVFPTEYIYVPLNKVTFWTRSILKIVNVGKKVYFCAKQSNSMMLV